MQFTIPAAAFLAFVTGALAQVPGFDTLTSPKEGEVFVTGETLPIVWEAAPAEYDDETVTIILISGKSRAELIPADEPVATGIVNSAGSFDWEIPAGVGGENTYGLKIQLDSDPEIFQYSFPFVIEEGDSVPLPSGNSTATPSGTATVSDVEEPSVTPPSNSTATRTPPKTTVTSTQSQDVPEPTDDAETPLPDSAAPANAVAGLALIGGLAVAAFGL